MCIALGVGAIATAKKNASSTSASKLMLGIGLSSEAQLEFSMVTRHMLTENQSAYISFGEVHWLTNFGAVPLEIIEVSFGRRLGKGKIVRLEDTYGRS
jgi:hypothetical protein